MIEVRKAQDRGLTDLGWLHSRHTFSFANYHDPDQVGFSALLVINDDRVQPGMGFGRHPHMNMEIFTYVLEGALEHKDSMGNGSVIQQGDLQMMSAGSGIRHSEFNHSQSECVHFLQIWIVPNQKQVEPRYQQEYFSASEKRGRLRLIISLEGQDSSLSVHQNVWAYAGLFHDDESAVLALGADRYAYVQVARGSIVVNGIRLAEGDGARIRGEQMLAFSAGQNAEVLVFNLPPHETLTV